MTVAEEIAERFDNDGQCFFDDEAVIGSNERIDDVCSFHAEKIEYNEDKDLTRYKFKDESAIVIAEGAWDIEGDEPFSWSGA